MDMQVPFQDDDVDQQLIEALREGETGALDEFMRRNQRWVRGVIYATVGQPDAVDDIAQKVWIHLWQRVHRLHDPRAWRSWLYRTARNAALDFGRKKTRMRNLWQRVKDRFDESDTISNENPEHTVDLEENRSRVLEAVETLPEIYRHPVIFRHLEGWTHRQIAEVLGVSPSTVEARLVRGRRMLRDKLFPGENE